MTASVTELKVTAEDRRVAWLATAAVGLALVDAAIASAADAILVHHGWFWRGEDGRVTGFRKARMQALLMHDINLIAYHLPLDGHVEFGNNAQLAKELGWTVEGRFGEQAIGLTTASMRICPVKFPSRMYTSHVSRASPTSLPDTMPRSVLACRPWRHTWENALA